MWLLICTQFKKIVSIQTTLFLDIFQQTGIHDALDSFCPCSRLYRTFSPRACSSGQVLICFIGEKTPSLSKIKNKHKKLRVLKLSDLSVSILTKHSVMHYQRNLSLYWNFPISAFSMCYSHEQKDSGNIFILSFKSKCCFSHIGEKIIHLANKYIKFQLLWILVGHF